MKMYISVKNYTGIDVKFWDSSYGLIMKRQQFFSVINSAFVDLSSRFQKTPIRISSILDFILTQNKFFLVMNTKNFDWKTMLLTFLY